MARLSMKNKLNKRKIRYGAKIHTNSLQGEGVM